MGEQALLLEVRELVANRRGPELDLGIGRERLGPDRLAGRVVGLDDLAQDQFLAGRDHPWIVGNRTSASAVRMIALPFWTARGATIATPSRTPRTPPVTPRSAPGAPPPRD